jgi:hypothetical protein
MSGAESPPLVRVYDLRDPAAQQAAHRHRGFWGKLYTEIHALDYDHVALVFRPAPDERWRAKGDGINTRPHDHALPPRWSGGDKAARTGGAGPEKRFCP